MLPERHVMNIDYIDELRELRVELGYRRVRASNHQRYARNQGVMSRRHIQSFNVVTARREHARHPCQRANLVLQKD